MEELPDPALIALVKGDDITSRARAIYILGERKATAAVLPLVEAMDDGALCPAVAGALARMEAGATPVLTRLLESPDPRLRKHAAFILGEFRSAAAIPHLVPLLGDPSRDVHTAAFGALGTIGAGALGDLQGAIGNPDPNIRIGIANALGIMASPVPPGEETPASLEDLLEDEGVPGGPEDGAGGLPGSGGGGPGGNRPFGLSSKNRGLAVSLLQQLMGDENPHVRDAASAAMDRAGGPSPGAVPEGLDSPDPRVRKDAIRALGADILFRETVAAIPPLIEALFDEDPEIRFLAAKSLRYSKDPRTIAPLNACLLDVSPDVRQEAVEGLRRRKDPRVLDSLLHALRDESAGVRRAAALALGEFSDTGARDALAECRHDGDRHVREAAARSLEMMGPDPRLDPRILVRSPDPETRSGAVAALGKGGDGNDLGLITASLADEDARVRRSAAEALCGFPDPAAVPPLLDALSDTDEHVRMHALRALQGIPDPRVLLPVIYALKDPHGLVRAEAVTHLRKLGDDEAVPYLIEALGDPDDGVCREAILLLGDIGGERTGSTLRDLEQKTKDPMKIAAIRTALDQISRTTATRATQSGTGAEDHAAPGKTPRATVTPGTTGAGQPGTGAEDHAAPGKTPRVTGTPGTTGAGQPGTGAADHAAPGKTPRVTVTPGTTGAGQSGAGAEDRVVISRKKNVEPARPLTRMATSQDEPESPEGDFSECLPLYETDPRAARMWQDLMDTAGRCLEKDDFASAKPLLENARDIFADSELLVTRLGLTLSGMGLYEEALGACMKGIAMNPRNDAFWSNAGALLANLERYDEALRYYKQALALCMSDENVWYQTGIVLNNLGRYAEAVKCFDRALLLNPAFPEAAEARKIARGNVWG